MKHATTIGEVRHGPLSGIKVLDLTIAMAGPLCTQRLAEMGADVVKIEAPGGGDFSRYATMAELHKFGDSVCFVALNRHKRSLVLDLKNEKGRAVLYRLAADADVFVHNFRPRVAGKLRIDYASMKTVNPRLVYASISGYGDDGPMKDRPGQDLLLQSFSGLTMNGGERGALPHPSPLYMVDVTASHSACEGVLAALVARNATQEGQEIKVSMMASMMEMQCQEITTYLNTDAPPVRGAAPQVSIFMEPPYGVYQCAEGHLSIAQADLDVLKDVLDVPELGELKRSRPAQADSQAVAAWRDEIYTLISARLVTHAASHWEALLSPLDVWCVCVQDYAEFLTHPQVQPHLTTMRHPIGGDYKTVAPAISFSSGDSDALCSAPAYGEHSRSVLRERGFSAGEVAALCDSGVVVDAAARR